MASNQDSINEDQINCTSSPIDYNLRSKGDLYDYMSIKFKFYKC